MRVGVLGGTFDPPHRGHLAMAEEAARRLALDKVLFVPAGDPWMKAGERITPADQRAEMVKLAIQGHALYELSRVEVDRSGPTFTVNTMDALHEQLGETTDLFFILGGDALLTLPQWREPERLVGQCVFVVLARPGFDGERIEEVVQQVPGLRERLVFLEGKEIAISGTEIRRRVALGEPISDMVPAAVEEYIRGHGLYR